MDLILPMPRKKKRGKKFQKESFTFTQFIMVVVVLALLITFLGKFTKEEAVNPVVQMPDFPSTEQGTFTGILQPEYPQEPIDQVVLLFASSKVPGLMLIYYPYEQRLIAGTPQMIIENIVFFDGQPHQIIYSFEQGGQQVLAYDGVPMAASDFHFYGGNAFTGMTLGMPEVVISEGFEKVRFS